MTPSPAGLTTSRSALPILLLVVFINLAGFGVVIPLLPFYAQSFGVAPWLVTLLFSAYSIGQLLGEPLWGRISDKIGRRPVLIGTIIATALSYLLLAYAESYAQAFGLRLLGGLAASNISTIQGYVADITPADKRAARMGLIGAAFGFGFVVGPSLGGLLADPSLGQAGFRLPLFVAATLSAVAAAGVILFVRESRPETSREHVPSGRFAVIGDAWGSPVVRRVLFSTFVATAAFSAMEAAFGIWAERRYGWGPREIGLLFGMIGILSALAQGVLVRLVVARIGEANTLAAGLALTSLSLFLQAASWEGWHVVASTVLTVLGISVTQPCISSLISRATRADHQGAMLGLNGATGAAARIVGPIVAGGLFAVTTDAPYYFAALALLPAVLLALRAGAAVRQLARLA